MFIAILSGIVSRDARACHEVELDPVSCSSLK